MKVYSLYHKGTYVASFPKREDAVDYGKEIYADGWDCDILEEYLSKTPYIGSPFTPLTNPSPTIPYTHPPIISKPPARFPDSYPDIYCGVKAND